MMPSSLAECREGGIIIPLLLLKGVPWVTCWVTAEVSFMKPEFGAQIAYGTSGTSGASPDDPEQFKQAVAKMSKGTTPYDMASIYTAHDVIDPRDTREWLIRMLEVHRLRMSGGVGQHLMRTWPTSY
jgi:methylmalonyl-CoA decarboxylase subunit alpha